MLNTGIEHYKYKFDRTIHLKLKFIYFLIKWFYLLDIWNLKYSDIGQLK